MFLFDQHVCTWNICVSGEIAINVVRENQKCNCSRHASYATEYAHDRSHNKTLLRRISLNGSTVRVVRYALWRDDRSLFIRLFVYSRVKGWLNRSVRATRERLHSGHCFRAAREFGGRIVTRFTACGYPQLELLRESRGFIWNFFKATAGRHNSQNLANDAESVVLASRNWI